MDECVFCAIVSGRQPARIVFQDVHLTAFWDIHPLAPIHILIIPNLHIASLMALLPEHHILLGHLLSSVPSLAREQGLEPIGYRVVINTGTDAGQTIDHLHLHLIGGKPMPFPN